VIFQKCELRTVQPPPVFSGSKQSHTNTSVLVVVAYRDLRDVAVDHLPVHWVGRSFESGVCESNNLTAERRDKSDTGYGIVGRMLPTIPVACQYGVKCWHRITFRIEAGVVLSTLEESAGNAACIF
jgi:hypothetical protein